MKTSIIPLFRSLCVAVALACGLSLTFTGCGSESAKKVLDKAKDAVKKTASKMGDVAKEAARPTKSNLTLVVAGREKPIEFNDGRAEMAALKNRPAAINVHGGGPNAEYPKFFLAVRGQAASPVELIGKSHDAIIYFQEKPNLPLYSTSLQKPAKVMLAGGDETYLEAKLESAELLDTTGQLSLNLTGDIIALVPQPKPKEEPKAEGKGKDKGPVSAEDKIKAAEKG